MSDRTLYLKYPDDEHLEIIYQGDVLVSANHDQHGWEGMEGIAGTAKAVAAALGHPVKDDNEPAEETGHSIHWTEYP